MPAGEAAEALNIDPSTLWRWSISGRIESEFLPDNTRAYRRDVVARLVVERAATQTDAATSGPAAAGEQPVRPALGDVA